MREDDAVFRSHFFSTLASCVRIKYDFECLSAENHGFNEYEKGIKSFYFVINLIFLRYMLILILLVMLLVIRDTGCFCNNTLEHSFNIVRYKKLY